MLLKFKLIYAIIWTVALVGLIHSGSFDQFVCLKFSDEQKIRVDSSLPKGKKVKRKKGELIDHLESKYEDKMTRIQHSSIQQDVESHVKNKSSKKSNKRKRNRNGDSENGAEEKKVKLHDKMGKRLVRS